MSWTLKKDTLLNKTLVEIGYFLPTANDKERRIIKNGDDLIGLVGEFVTEYDQGKTVSKNLFNRWRKIIELQADYKINWKITREGELLNEKENVIFIFVNPDSFFAKIIVFLPEIYSCSQDLLKNLSSTNRHAVKNTYNKICDFYDKIHES